LNPESRSDISLGHVGGVLVAPRFPAGLVVLAVARGMTVRAELATLLFIRCF